MLDSSGALVSALVVVLEIVTGWQEGDFIVTDGLPQILKVNEHCVLNPEVTTVWASQGRQYCVVNAVSFGQSITSLCQLSLD